MDAFFVFGNQPNAKFGEFFISADELAAQIQKRERKMHKR
jgi:hypothetical protein